jgi:wobble nucleotide-excising tRNase
VQLLSLEKNSAKKISTQEEIIRNFQGIVQELNSMYEGSHDKLKEMSDDKQRLEELNERAYAEVGKLNGKLLDKKNQIQKLEKDLAQKKVWIFSFFSFPFLIETVHGAVC